MAQGRAHAAFHCCWVQLKAESTPPTHLQHSATEMEGTASPTHRLKSQESLLFLGLSEEPRAPELTLAPASNSHWSPGALQHWQSLSASLLRVPFSLQAHSLTTTNTHTPNIASEALSCFQPEGGAGFPQLPVSQFNRGTQWMLL